MLFPSSLLCHRVWSGVCLGQICQDVFIAHSLLTQDVLLQFRACELLHVTQKRTEASRVASLLLCPPLSAEPLVGALWGCWCRREAPQVESAGRPWRCMCGTWQAEDCCWVMWYGEAERGRVLREPCCKWGRCAGWGGALQGLQPLKYMSGWGAYGLEHMAEEQAGYCSAPPLPLCISSVQKAFERLPEYQPCMGALVGLLAGSPATSSWG